MQLMIAGEARAMVPLKAFRAQHGLPEAFGVAYFEPKSYAGLGSIDAAGPALDDLHETVLTAVPERISLAEGLAVVERLQMVFEQALWRINPQVGLQEQEIAFAAAGLGAVLRAWFYALMLAHTGRAEAPCFEVVYQGWLQDTLQLAAPRDYAHTGELWRVQVISHAYGRVGLWVELPSGEAVAVADARLACPAQAFMTRFLAALCARFAARVV
ncbi:MAG: hypothetical protein ACLFTK_14980 [Anaerolineales bacterium]